MLLTFEKIKEYYDNKFWNKAMVWDSVSKNKINQSQYTQITDEAYPIARPIKSE
ncbi:XkdX family protein [Haloimpatiens sp. FM7315]|uniref:XkdX family protein n=1 Tax=Haloimpatiens sp. FM7315 TaxID=3298609 RepID=UPI0035A30C79